MLAELSRRIKTFGGTSTPDSTYRSVSMAKDIAAMDKKRTGMKKSRVFIFFILTSSLKERFYSYSPVIPICFLLFCDTLKVWLCKVSAKVFWLSQVNFRATSANHCKQERAVDLNLYDGRGGYVENYFNRRTFCLISGKPGGPMTV